MGKMEVMEKNGNNKKNVIGNKVIGIQLEEKMELWKNGSYVKKSR